MESRTTILNRMRGVRSSARKGLTVSVFLLSMLILMQTTATAGTYHRSINVHIPFSDPGNKLSGPALMQFDVPRGNYQITLQVDKAPWDMIGVAGGVPVGMQTRIVIPPRNEVFYASPWTVQPWKVHFNTYVADGRALQVLFSTMAPLGAEGVLTITQY